MVRLAFPNRKGAATDGDDFRRRVFYMLIEKADVPKFRFHDMILGKVDAKSVESIERGLAKLPHVLLPFDVISNGQQVLMIIILKRDRPLLDR